jgi:pyruvate/2-oxoglutarate dehydrogenase complex dihydrolipoamide dehydrogenase (E3) component/uncharacterized membrane protein YdjX (TVP38/TMEM64 family)
MKLAKIMVVMLIVGWIFAYFAFDLGQYFTLSFFKAQQSALQTYYAEQPWRMLLLFALVYMIVAVPSLPGAALMTLAAGALFGVLVGTVLISLASVIAALLTFVSSRFLFRDLMQSKFATSLRTVNAGVAKDGALYLFVLRLSPIFPFFIVNVLMGLTSIPLWTFLWVTQVGVIPGSAIFVAAGTEFTDLDDLSGILSPRLAIYLTLLGLLPIVTRKLIALVKLRRLLRPFPKPRQFDRNLIVIGSSPAAVIASNAANAVQARVSLVTPADGTTRLPSAAAIPSKVLLRSARHVFEAQRARASGLLSARASIDFAELMAHAQSLAASAGSRCGNIDTGIEQLCGTAQILSPYAVRIAGRTLTTRNILIATGSRARIPEVPGLAEMDYVTTDTVLCLRSPPRRLLVLGGGPAGCELAQCFARLGAQVTLVEREGQLLPTEDADIAAVLTRQFHGEGIDVRLGTQPREFQRHGTSQSALCYGPDGQVMTLDFDTLILAAGRWANTDELDLEHLGLALSSSGGIAVNEYSQTIFPSIYACGDVAAPGKFVDQATDSAGYAALNALFRWRHNKIDYALLPWTTLTDPAIARVGYNEQDAQRVDLPYQVLRYSLNEFSGRWTPLDGEPDPTGLLIKVLTAPGKDKILGLSLAGPRANELIAEYAAVVRHGLELPALRNGNHAYTASGSQPSQANADWSDAARLPVWLAPWIARFHAWQRGQQPSPP